jgi:hypothetical protein
VRGATVIATELQQIANGLCCRCIDNEIIESLKRISTEIQGAASILDARCFDNRPHPRCPVGCLAVPAREPSYSRPTFCCVSCGTLFSPPRKKYSET